MAIDNVIPIIGILVTDRLSSDPFFFLFHPRDYYKLSLCVTFANTFDNLWNYMELCGNYTCHVPDNIN